MFGQPSIYNMARSFVNREVLLVGTTGSEGTNRWRPLTFSLSEPKLEEIVLNSTCFIDSGSFVSVRLWCIR